MKKYCLAIAIISLLASPANAFSTHLLCQPGATQFDQTPIDTGLSVWHGYEISSTASQTEYYNSGTVVSVYADNHPIYGKTPVIYRIAASASDTARLSGLPFTTQTGITFHLVVHGSCDPAAPDIVRLNLF